MWKYTPTEELEFCFGWSKGFIVKLNRKKSGQVREQAGWDRFLSVYCLVPEMDFVPLESFSFFFFRRGIICSVFLKEDNSSNSINNEIRLGETKDREMFRDTGTRIMVILLIHSAYTRAPIMHARFLLAVGNTKENKIETFRVWWVETTMRT